MDINKYELMFSEIQDIYDSFEDELSKKIFEKRLVYNLSQHPSDLDAFLRVSHQGYSGNDRMFIYDGLHSDPEFWMLDNETPLVIYGASEAGRCYFDIYGLENRKNTVFCDRNYADIKTLCGVDVVSPDVVINGEVFNKQPFKILVAANESIEEIVDFLLDNAIAAKDILVTNRDYKDIKKMYFEPFFTCSEDEVFVDAGVFDGATSIRFAEWVENEYEKIYMFEADENNYHNSMANIEKFGLKNAEIYNVGVWAEKGVIKIDSTLNNSSKKIHEHGDIEINVDTIDNVLVDKKVTFIKMDIEGAELAAIKGASNTIRKHKPKLAISLYHKPEDIVAIPSYIKSLIPEYKFYIRHHTTAYFETVLYATT